MALGMLNRKVFRLCLLLIVIFLNLMVKDRPEHVCLTSPSAAKEKRTLGFIK